MEYLLEAVNKYSFDMYRIKKEVEEAPPTLEPLVDVSNNIKQEPVKGFEYTDIYLSSFLSLPTIKRERVYVGEEGQVGSDECHQGRAGQEVVCKEPPVKSLAAQDTLVGSQVLVANLTAQSTRHCKFCSKEFQSKVSCRKHEAELHVVKLLICKTCQKECLSSLALRNHMKSHQFRACDNCFNTINMNNFTRHVKTCFAKTFDMKLPKASSKTLKCQKLRDNQTSECSNCFKEFSWVQSLRRHKKLCGAKVDKEFKCHLCSKSFSWKQSLTRHTLSLH